MTAICRISLKIHGRIEKLLERQKQKVQRVWMIASVSTAILSSMNLADADAYRCDRRKDALLQEHGYFVLRFLAEDVGKRLDDVLDATVRALAHRRVALGNSTT